MSIQELIQEELENRSLRNFAAWWNEGLPEQFHISHQTARNWRDNKHIPDPIKVNAARAYYSAADRRGYIARRILAVVLPDLV